MIEKRSLGEGTWKYRWNAAGMLREVVRPDGDAVTFTYDVLGRRVSKTYMNTTTKWVWDGNVPIHEWKERGPASVANRAPTISAARADTPALAASIKDDLFTYLFEPGTFAPLAKLTPTDNFSVLTDHLGTPTALYDQTGKERWRTQLDIYGRCLKTDGWADHMLFC